MLDLCWVMWSFYFPHGNPIFAIWRRGISTNGGDSNRQKLLHSYRSYFLLCYDFMSQLHKSNRYYLTDVFPIPLNTLTIFIIDNIDFDKHIPDIYPTKLHLNKANTVEKETFLLDLNVKVTSDDFGFPKVYFLWFSGDVPRRPSYVFF